MTTRDTPEAALAAAINKHGNHGSGSCDARCAAAILAALADWTLVPGGGDVIERGIELARQQAAEIARLRRDMVAIATQRNEALAEIERPRAALDKAQEAICKPFYPGHAPDCPEHALAPSDP